MFFFGRAVLITLLMSYKVTTGRWSTSCTVWLCVCVCLCGDLKHSSHLSQNKEISSVKEALFMAFFFLHTLSRQRLKWKNVCYHIRYVHAQQSSVCIIYRYSQWVISTVTEPNHTLPHAAVTELSLFSRIERKWFRFYWTSLTVVN